MPDRTVNPPRPWWTPWPNTGPSHEVLGSVAGRNLVELGCGHGSNAAAFAAQGAYVTAIDGDPEVCREALRRWGSLPRLRVVCSSAVEYLALNTEPVDVVVSIFGAASYTTAERLLPVVASRLQPRGTLAVAARMPPRDPHREPLGWVPFSRTPHQWRVMLDQHGFVLGGLQRMDHPDDSEAPGALIFTATARSRH